MINDITERIMKEAYFIAQTGATVRKTAQVFHFSKSTVHKDVSYRLIHLDRELYAKVKIALQKNLAERHIRGGEATRKKYLELRGEEVE